MILIIFLLFFVERLFLDDPELQDDIPPRFKSHKEIYEDAIRKGCHVIKKVRELQESGKGDMDMFVYVKNIIIIILFYVK